MGVEYDPERTNSSVVAPPDRRFRLRLLWGMCNPGKESWGPMLHPVVLILSCQRSRRFRDGPASVLGMCCRRPVDLGKVQVVRLEQLPLSSFKKRVGRKAAAEVLSISFTLVEPHPGTEMGCNLSVLHLYYYGVMWPT